MMKFYAGGADSVVPSHFSVIRILIKSTTEPQVHLLDMKTALSDFLKQTMSCQEGVITAIIESIIKRQNK